MNCKRVLEKLSAFQDRELPAQQGQQIEKHLASCADCREELAALNQLVGNLCRLIPPAPSPDFSSRIMAGLRKRPEKKYRLLPSLAYTLACLMIFISGFLLEISSTSQPAVIPQPATTFSSVLTESRDLGLLSVQDSTMELFSNLKQINLVKKQDNVLSKSLIPPLQGTSLRSRVNGTNYEKQ